MVRQGFAVCGTPNPHPVPSFPNLQPMRGPRFSESCCSQDRGRSMIDGTTTTTGHTQHAESTDVCAVGIFAPCSRDPLCCRWFSFTNEWADECDLSDHVHEHPACWQTICTTAAAGVCLRSVRGPLHCAATAGQRLLRPARLIFPEKRAMRGSCNHQPPPYSKRTISLETIEKRLLRRSRRQRREGPYPNLPTLDPAQNWRRLRVRRLQVPSYLLQLA